jgi:hypothetical protein
VEKKCQKLVGRLPINLLTNLGNHSLTTLEGGSRKFVNSGGMARYSSRQAGHQPQKHDQKQAAQYNQERENDEHSASKLYSVSYVAPSLHDFVGLIAIACRASRLARSKIVATEPADDCLRFDRFGAVRAILRLVLGGHVIPLWNEPLLRQPEAYIGW